MVDMNHDDSNGDKKEEKGQGEGWKTEKKKKNGDDCDDKKAYLKEAIFGKKDGGDFSDDDDGTSIVSEAGVYDAGALSRLYVAVSSK